MSQATSSETVLLVEDEHSVRVMMRIVLETAGYRVLEASNGAEAISCAGQHHDKIHLLATDVVMPGGVSGPILAAQLAALHPGLRVLFISAHSDEVITRHGVTAEKHPFLRKPFTHAELLRAIDETASQNY
ncbi:MAG TPA: response regulator [Gemmataceae bacterium]|nr:response regulator [Gemmataceae bacterium]